VRLRAKRDPKVLRAAFPCQEAIMRVRTAALSIALVLATIAAGTLFRQPQAVGSSTPDRLYDSDYTTAAAAISSLFAGASDEKLVQLKSDPDIGISLYAAWWMRSSQNPHFIAASHPERFIGFLEGRTGLTCPPNWASSFVMRCDRERQYLSGALKSYEPIGLVTIEDESLGLKRGEGVTCVKDFLHESHTVIVNGIQMRCPNTINVNEGRLLVAGHSIPLQFLRSELQKLQNSTGVPDEFNAIVHHGRAFVAGLRFGGFASPLLCLDVKTGKVQWIAKLWGCRSPQSFAVFGQYSHVVELSADDDLIGVFGIEGTNYVEAFDVKTGAPRFRFEPGLWRVSDNPWNARVRNSPRSSEKAEGEEQ
jgi:hypothetical protein